MIQDKHMPERLPLTYIQSGFTTDDPPAWFYKTYELKRLRVECAAQFFDGAEVLDLNVDSQAGREDVRRLAKAMADVSKHNGRAFHGFWSFPRLPGFFWPDHIKSQPAKWRAVSLKSNGDVWTRNPSLPEENESKIKFTGEYLDITNDAAVERLLENVARVFRWDGPQGECVGPLPGYIVLNEWLLSSNYESVWSKHVKEHDVDSPDRVMRLGNKTHRQLFTDDDPYYSYLNPPKRCVPLYSHCAQQKFTAYAHAKGYAFTKLPADRNELNDDDATVSLPDWVEFVDESEADHWQVWEEWVYQTWSTFVERVCREWALAQRGNRRYKGVIYFQLPMWYSIRKRSREPVTYRYIDESGAPRTDTIVMADYAEYDRLNPVAMGTDMEYLMRSPWLAGMVHETTKSIHVRGKGGMTQPQYDELVHGHDRFRHYFMAQGALAKEVCRAHGKLFGAFARSQFFKGRGHLPPEGFAAAFDRTIFPLMPDVIATIGPWFVDRDRVDPKYRPVVRGCTGELQDVWLRRCAGYRERYAAERPY